MIRWDKEAQKIQLAKSSNFNIDLHDSFVARELEGKIDANTITLLADSYRHAGDLPMASRLDNLASFFPQ